MFKVYKESLETDYRTVHRDIRTELNGISDRVSFMKNGVEGIKNKLDGSRRQKHHAQDRECETGRKVQCGGPVV